MNNRTAYPWASLFIVMLFAAIVILPVTFALWPQEQAKWKVAAAANALDQGKFETTLKLLDEAREADPSIPSNASYQWTWLRMLTQMNNDEDVLAFLSHAKGESQLALLNLLVEELRMTREFGRAVHFLRKILPASDRRTPGEKNDLAYTLSLAEVDEGDLEEALQQVDQAMAAAERKEELPTFQDTKAWVLYKLQRYAEALPLAEAAVVGTEATLTSLNLIPGDIQSPAKQPNTEADSSTAEIDPSTDEGSQAKEGKLSRSKQELRALRRLPVFSLAVIRYHRAKILDALSEKERAQADYDWLDRKGFKDLDDLH